MTITTTEVIYEDGNRATTIFLDDDPIVIVTMGDGEHELQYLGSIQAHINEIGSPAAIEEVEVTFEIDDGWGDEPEEVSAEVRKGT